MTGGHNLLSPSRSGALAWKSLVNFPEHEVERALVLEEVGGPYRTRTYNQLIKSQLLYQLS